MHADYTVQETLCTIHKTHNHFIQKKIYIKMGPTVLFTHLKIILLQCFQFSVFMMNVQLVRSIFGYKEFCIKVNQEPKKKIRVYVRISKEFSLT